MPPTLPAEKTEVVRRPGHPARRGGYWRSGDAGVWLIAGATGGALLLILGLLALVARGGLGFFWPAPLTQFRLADGSTILGIVWAEEPMPIDLDPEGGRRLQIKAANRDRDPGREYSWVPERSIVDRSRPRDAVVVERRNEGEFFGYLDARGEDGTLSLHLEGGGAATIEAPEVVRWFRPNELSILGKARVYGARLWEFVSTSPRQANTQGGILPALFGTVLMVFLMTLAVVPLGVIAALYLREYARQGWMVRAVRIAVHNLAGIPSIVFGIFSLGFFVYFVGGSIDRLFFADNLPSPTFGTGGILWSALTLALLTLPVVIVSTEEGLAAVPTAIREGSLALGATKWETTWRVILPAASPGILTGVILAMARAAGEVAPLMLTGAVKVASELPLSGEFPFLHLDRKFMHLGFHIYDVGFQSPNVEAAKPMVYMTTLLLVALVVVLNLVAMAIRNRLRSRYRSNAF